MGQWELYAHLHEPVHEQSYIYRRFYVADVAKRLPGGWRYKLGMW
jgi:hypothetical protein